MKKSLLIIALACSVASAKELTVSGFGNSYERALENAKQEAIEQVAGTFVMGERNAKNGKVSEQIDQYNGGIINTYKVVGHQESWRGHLVTIVADVEPKKDNRIHNKQSVEFDPKFDEFEQRKVIVDRLDGIKQAVSIDVSKPEYVIGRYETTVDLNIRLALQPKWYTDLKAFTDVIDEEGSTTNNAYESLHATAVSALLTVNPAAAVLASLAEAPQAKQSSEQMVCFATRVNSFMDCKNISVEFVKLPRTPTIIVAGIVNGQQHIVYKQRLSTSLYEFVDAGDRKGHYFFRSYKKTFNQPALIVYENEKQDVYASFRVNTNLAKNITEYKVYLQ